MRNNFVIELAIPNWAVYEIVNGGDSSLNSLELLDIHSWMRIVEKVHNAKMTMVSFGDNAEPYFSNNPAFGMPTNVYDCTILMEPNVE